MQAFDGALAGQRANRGVFITTSTFSHQAVEFAGSVERIVLVDGSKLADLMIEYEVGLPLARCEYPRSIRTISKSSGQLSNLQMEPTRRTTSAIMSLRRAAHLNRYAAREFR